MTIHENGGIFNAALRPASNWDLNGTVETHYNDNVFTPVASGSRSTTGCIPSTVQSHGPRSPAHSTTWSGTTTPITTRASRATPGLLSARSIMSIIAICQLGRGAVAERALWARSQLLLQRRLHGHNICFQGAATPCRAAPACRAPQCQTGSFAALSQHAHGAEHTVLVGPARDFMDAPTQYGSAAFMYSPTKKVHSDIGYRISSVNGSRFFTMPATSTVRWCPPISLLM